MIFYLNTFWKLNMIASFPFSYPSSNPSFNHFALFKIGGVFLMQQHMNILYTNPKIILVALNMLSYV